MTWTGISDLLIGLTYALGPLIWYLFNGDKRPAPIDGMARNT